MSNNILFITDRNILTTCGELRLIKNRAEVLFKQWNINTDFIVLARKNRINSEHEKINIPCCMKIMERSVFNLVFEKQIRQTINDMMQKKEYKVIILSGLLMEKLLPYIKNKFPECKVISDIHGAAEDVLEVSKKANYVKRFMLILLYMLEKYCLIKYLRKVDGIFVVSTALKKYLDSNFMTNDIPSFKIPCATNSYAWNSNEYNYNRTYYRNKYLIAPDEKLFIYSGGISSWQCVNETIDIYKKMSCRNSKIKMLFLSHDVDKIDRQIIEKLGIITDSYSALEVEKVLCAGDYAFLLRKENITNEVAYPNKFLEYVKSGMHIITTPYIQDVFYQVQKYNLGTSIEFKNSDIDKLLKYIDKTENYQIDFTVREKVLVENAFCTTLQSFVKQYFSDGEVKL